MMKKDGVVKLKRNIDELKRSKRGKKVKHMVKKAKNT